MVLYINKVKGISHLINLQVPEELDVMKHSCTMVYPCVPWYPGNFCSGDGEDKTPVK